MLPSLNIVTVLVTPDDFVASETTQVIMSKTPQIWLYFLTPLCPPWESGAINGWRFQKGLVGDIGFEPVTSTVWRLVYSLLRV